ncbi:MAG TPA: helicase-related protein [Myxococcota bacterium]|nr:helicase-related protein [Myxococcota bacterium]
MHPLLPGTQVHARGTLWEVVHVEPAGTQQRIRLRAQVEGLRGRELDILHPFESVDPVRRDFNPSKAGRLAPWRLYHQAFLLDQALGSNALVATQPGRLDIAPYQLVPVMRALRMTRPRLMLADGVGLGKTVQAGFILTELIARRRAHRILIVCPPGPLLNQWNRELRTRFGLRFDVIRDQSDLQELRRKNELGANPFDHVSFCLTSVDFARQEKVVQDLERTTWDIIVIDEAHHCVRMGTAGDRESSLRRRLAEVLSRQCDGLLLLTATPHDGYDGHFASLVELLDPSLVDGRGSLRGEDYRRHVVRRLKHHVKGPDGNALFPERIVTPVPVKFEDRPAYAALQSAILTMVVPRLNSALRRKRFGEVLAFVSLLKRGVSTVAACKNTLTHVANRYGDLLRGGQETVEARKQRLTTLRDYRRRLEKYGSLSWEEEQDQAVLEAEDIAAELFTPEFVDLLIRDTEADARRDKKQAARTAEIEKELRSLVALAEAAANDDVKLDAIVREVRRIRAAEPRANVLVYTEYTDSQDAVVVALKSATFGGEVLAISGPDSDAVRTKITERFSSDDNLVLVSTDATAEGLNLHTRCHHLVHVELPYNPNRLEQRNGRIDRYGQKLRPEVSYLYLARTFEERLLLRLVRKVEKQRERLTFVPDTLGNVLIEDDVEAKLIAGLAAENPTLFSHSAGPREEDTESESFRELMAEVDRAIAGFDKTAKGLSWLGESGLNADDRLVREAESARAAGDRQSAVKLLDFVADAVEVDAGGALSRVGDLVTLKLPALWTPGLDDVPGYDAASTVMRLTSDPARTQDADGPIGYLGRAHPLVRRALDRVRNLQFGSTGGFDRRVSAAAWNGPPAVLWTYLGTVRTTLGRAFERVVAVRATTSGVETLLDPGVWESLAAKGVATAGLWESQFASWAPDTEHAARAAAAAAFGALCKEYHREQAAVLDGEQAEVDRWVRERTQALCGAEESANLTLFNVGPKLPPWKTLRNPAERLAAYATDGDVPSSSRREAETALKLYRDRIKDLDRRRPLPGEIVTPLGLLLLVPVGA